MTKTNLPAGGSKQAEQEWRKQHASAQSARFGVTPPPHWGWLVVELIAASALFLAFLIVKSFSFHWEVGDENIYFYMAWASWDHGALPYRDYFFAHPPLHLLPGIPLFGLFGVSPVTARLLPVGATLGSGVLLYLLARRHMGRLAALCTLFLFLFNFGLLRASSHWTGINLTVLWLTAGLYFFANQRPLLAGIAAALAACTGNYALPGAIMLGMLWLLDSPRAALRNLIGFAAPWALVQLSGYLVGGSEYFNAVYFYHVQKVEKEGVARAMLFRELFDNTLIYITGAIGPLIALWDRLLRSSTASRPAAGAGGFLGRVWRWIRRALLEDGAGEFGPRSARGLARIGALWSLGFLLFLFMLPRVFPFYFLLLFPGLALAGGFAMSRVVHHAAQTVKTWREPNERSQRWWRIVLVGAVPGVCLLGWLLREPFQQAFLPNYTREQPVPMVWSDSPWPVNSFMRSCCWSDVAEAGTLYGTLTEVLFHESRYFTAAEQLAAHLRNYSQPNATLFGDSSTAGLIALLADRRLEGDFADTNTMRFTSFNTPPLKAIELIDRPSLRFVLVQAHRSNGALSYQAFASVPEFRRWLDLNFMTSLEARDQYKGSFVLLRRSR